LSVGEEAAQAALATLEKQLHLKKKKFCRMRKLRRMQKDDKRKSKAETWEKTTQEVRYTGAEARNQPGGVKF